MQEGRGSGKRSKRGGVILFYFFFLGLLYLRGVVSCLHLLLAIVDI